MPIFTICKRTKTGPNKSCVYHKNIDYADIILGKELHGCEDSVGEFVDSLRDCPVEPLDFVENKTC